MSRNKNVYQYHVNAGNEITAVNEAWDAFASYNQGAHLQSKEVVGKPLLKSIPDARLRDIYERLLESVRRSESPARIPFRCDAPDERRFMSLEISPEADGGLVLSGRLLKREFRAPVALLRPDLERSNEDATLCSICLRMRTPDERWLEIEEALEDPLDNRPGRVPCINWYICPDCTACFEEQMGD